MQQRDRDGTCPQEAHSKGERHGNPSNVAVPNALEVALGQALHSMLYVRRLSTEFVLFNF